MGMMESYIDILNDSLSRKEAILDELIRKSTDHMNIIAQELFDAEEFDRLTSEKTDLINKLNSIDEGFQTLYDRVREELVDNKFAYSKQIGEMQNKISRILEKSNHLMSMERRTKASAEKQFAILHKEVKVVKKNQQYADNYYKSMNRISEEPLFMDKKK